jgi:hypothetical protein
MQMDLQKDSGMKIKEDWEILQFDPNKIIARQRELGKELIEKQALYEELTDLKKSMKDEQASVFLNGGKGLGESEMRANASNEFKSFLAELSKARKEYLEAKMMYDSFINWTRLLQSRGANLRAEMNMTGSL